MSSFVYTYISNKKINLLQNKSNYDILYLVSNMKKLGKILLSVFIVLYAVVAIFLTACLLNYNDYKITVFGDKSLIIVNDDALKDKYKKGSLLVVDKNGSEEIKSGDEIIFYNTYNNQVSIALGEVISTEKITETETTYTVTGNYDISSEYLVGSADNTKVYPVIGSILGILESRVGFLIFIIFPITLAFLYEIYILITEIKEVKEEEKTNTKEKVEEDKE